MKFTRNFIALTLVVSFLGCSDQTDVELVYGDEMSKAHQMIRRGESVDSIMGYLESHPAEIEARNLMGENLMHSAILKHRFDLIVPLADMGLDVNEPVQYGVIPFAQTPLHLAVSENDKTICKILIVIGADLEIRDALNRTPVQYAEKIGFERIARMLQVPDDGNIDGDF